MSLCMRWLIVGTLLMACACAKTPIAQQSRLAEDATAQRVYQQVRGALDRGDGQIDYETLIFVHQTLSGTETAVPHLDLLLFDLLAKRNKDRRLDQMAVILTADIIGRSKHPIAGVSDLFDAMLQMDDDRLDNWVLIFVADALGRYAFDLPDGDRLADLVEARVEQAHQAFDPSRERFGQHFLPPPKSKRIVDHIAGVADQKARQQEREAYYMLILRQHAEEEIDIGLRYLQTHALAGREEKQVMLLSYILQHWDEVQLAVPEPRSSNVEF